MRTLFDTTQIKGLTLDNRIVRAATWERMANEDGSVTQELIDLYAELAKGGVGLIITGYAFIMDNEQPNPKMMGMSNDSFIPGYKQLVDTVHQYNTGIIMQLAYGGTQTRFQTENREIWGPSQVQHPKTGVIAKEMTKDDMSTLIDSFANAALRAKKCGFDGIELHGAHGYLLSQFLSPNFNYRKDSYGGSLDNRMRVISEIYEQTRSLVGEDFLIMIKINASDFTEGGFTYEECQYVCQKLDNLGFDAIELSGPKPPGTKKKDQSILANYAAHLASILKIPVISVGKHRDYNLLTQILNQTEIEYFSMSRPFIAEPNLVHRWISGDTEESKCISCGQCYHPEGISCILK